MTWGARPSDPKPRLWVVPATPDPKAAMKAEIDELMRGRVADYDEPVPPELKR